MDWKKLIDFLEGLASEDEEAQCALAKFAFFVGAFGGIFVGFEMGGVGGIFVGVPLVGGLFWLLTPLIALLAI